VRIISSSDSCELYGVENSRVTAARGGQLAAMTGWVNCGRGSHIGRHADREIALGIMRRIRRSWNLRRSDRGELHWQMVGDMMRRETVACGRGLAAGSVWNAYVTQCMCELRRYAEAERTGMDSCAAVVV
jgi:hypothetical protein